MKQITTYITLILALAFFGCSESNNVSDIFTKAEQLMNVYPDSALMLLQSVDADKLTTKEGKARHALLLSQALDKNYIDLTSDSIINIAVEYYTNSNDKERYFTSLYYLARIQYNRNDYVNAIITLTQAEELSQYIKDNYKLALLYGWIGHIYNDVFDATKSLTYYKKAKNFYHLCNNEYLEYDKILSMADAYYKLEKFEETENHIKTVIEWAYKNNVKDLLQESTEGLITLYETRGEYDKLEPFYNSNYFSSCDSTVTLLLSLARRYACKADKEISKKYSTRASEMMIDKNDSLIFYERMRVVNMYLENYKAAAECTNKLLHLYNRDVKIAMLRPVSSVLNDFYCKQIEHNEYKAKMNFTLFCTTFLLFIMLLIILYFIYKYYNSKLSLRNAEIENLMAIANNLENEIGLQKTPNYMVKKIQTLFEERFALLNKLCTTYYETSYFNKERESIFREVRKEIDNFVNDKETLNKLRKQINDYKEDIITRLESDFPHFNEKEKLIYTLLLAGFSAKAIAVIVGVNRDVVYARKSRLRKQIIELKNDNKAVYEKFFL